MQIFIEKIGLKPIILDQQANKGLTIIEKLENNTDVEMAVVLYTPCDEGKAQGNSNYNKRARQNVVFEHGFEDSEVTVPDFLVTGVGNRFGFNINSFAQPEIQRIFLRI